ncbi:type IV conjugative transfer system protein TraE [Escherichia coli]|nr:type IV conjugative transfer system protein TraE [Escherichia coli]
MEHGARLSTSRVMAIAFIFMSVLIVLSLSVNVIQGVNNYRLQNEQRTAVTPMAFNAPFAVSQNSADASYLQQMALSFIALRLNVSSETVDASHQALLQYIRPGAQNQMKVILAEEAQRIKNDNVNSAFFQTSVRVWPQYGRVEIRGVLKTWIGDSKPFTDIKHYILILKRENGVTWLDNFGETDDEKHGKGSVANDVTDEMVRLNWLTEFMPLPTIKHFIRTPDDAWLLTTAIPGKTAFQVLEEYPDSGENIVDALAVFLRRLHSIPVCNCPFNSDRVFRLAQAQSRMNNGLVDASDFDDERNGWPVEQVWKEMHKLLPFSPDSVVTHGDFSLDNLIFDEGKLIGCIDVGRVGIADRYQDLAILWNCLGEFSPSLQKRLFQKYGIDNPDMNKLQFHLMLDEFF